MILVHSQPSLIFFCLIFLHLFLHLFCFSTVLYFSLFFLVIILLHQQYSFVSVFFASHFLDLAMILLYPWFSFIFFIASLLLTSGHDLISATIHFFFFCFIFLTSPQFYFIYGFHFFFFFLLLQICFRLSGPNDFTFHFWLHNKSLNLVFSSLFVSTVRF